jgi:hypothetical protein
MMSVPSQVDDQTLIDSCCVAPSLEDSVISHSIKNLLFTASDMMSGWLGLMVSYKTRRYEI